MTYTPKQRKLIANVFTNALLTLPTSNNGPQSKYICDNIWVKKVLSEHQPAFNAHQHAVDIISERINGCFGVETWLSKNYPHLKNEIRDDYVNNAGRKMQAYRKQWLKQLVAEFNA